MDIHIDEWGWGFVWECFRRFQGEGIFFVFFLLSVIAAAFFLKNQWKKGLLAYLLFLALTVFNPILINPVVGLLDLDDEYYRFIWLLPVTILIAWFAVYLVERAPKAALRAVVCALCIIALAFPGKTILARGLEPAENLYKIPDEVIEVCETIHDISGEENLTLYVDFDLAVLINQYDPSYEMALSYSDISIFQSSYDSDKTEEYDGVFSPELISKWFLYQIFELNNTGAEIAPLARSLDWLGTDYVVLRRDEPMLEYAKEQNCVPVYETETYIIMEFLGE